MKLELEQDGNYWNVVDEKGRKVAFETVSKALAYIHEEEREDFRRNREISLELTVGELEFLDQALKHFPYGYADDDTKEMADAVSWIIKNRVREEANKNLKFVSRIA